MQNKPYSKVSISDICESMKCSRQSFYYYFNTIEACLSYYIKESFVNQIKEDYLISDIFNYFENNISFVKLCESDVEAKDILWHGLYIYTKKMLDLIFSKNILEYLSLYNEQKDALISFYVAGILDQAMEFVRNKFIPSKEKCINYCKAIIGSIDTTKETIARFNR